MEYSECQEHETKKIQSLMGVEPITFRTLELSLKT